RCSVPAVVATIQADNQRAVDFLRAVAPGSRPVHVGGAELEVTIPVAPARRPVPAPQPAAAASRPAQTEAA
ncbi:MAG TPA: hypothetical protein VF015_02250, partial [Acidimicrobiales bacterium]